MLLYRKNAHFIIFFIFGLLLMSTRHNPENIETLRALYQKAEKDEDSATRLYLIAKEIESPKAVEIGYLAAGLAYKSKYSINPYTKLSKIKEAHRTFEKAIQQAPNDVEIRFLRLAVEANTPNFLDMSGHIEEDKTVIKEGFDAFSSRHPDFSTYMIGFFEVSDQFSQQEIKALHARL
jgi:tetratricopeptide (TPR) repeat protein